MKIEPLFSFNNYMIIHMGFLNKLFGSKENEDKLKQEEKPVNAPQQEDVLESFKKVPWMTDMRLNNARICLDAGFRPSNALPTEFDHHLRPAVEIAQRLHVIKVLVMWLLIPEEHLPSERIMSFIRENKLDQYMSDEEKAILNASRDDEDMRNQIGWKFENAWPLAWYFGYAAPKIDGVMMTGEEMNDILLHHTCPLSGNLVAWVAEKNKVSDDSVLKMEDLFYCLHNAVRSAQMGRPSVPQGFNPMSHGGVIHERRHALTWMVSKGTAWDDTELSA